MPQLASAPPRTQRPEWLVQFGRRLLLARGRAGLTQGALAAPDLSKSFISLLESGRSHPSVETVVTLARRLGSAVGALLLDPAELRLETAQNLVHLASQADPAGRGQAALQMVAAAEALLSDMPVHLRAQAGLVRARVAIAAGRLDEAERLADGILSLARRHTLRIPSGVALSLKGLIALRRNQFAAALPLLEDAVETLRRARAARTEDSVRALLSLGAARFELGQVERAQQAYRRALDLAARLGLAAMRGRALSGLGLVAWTRGNLAPAAAHLSQAREAFTQVEDLPEISRALCNLGLVRREQGRLDEALQSLQQALRLQDRLKAPADRSAILDEIAQVLLAGDRLADAGRAARRAIQEARTARSPAREAAASVTLARVVHRQGRRPRAIRMLRAAVATFKRLGLAGRAAAAAGELGLMLRDAGEADVAAPYLAAVLTAPAPEQLGPATLTVPRRSRPTPAR